MRKILLATAGLLVAALPYRAAAQSAVRVAPTVPTSPAAAPGPPPPPPAALPPCPAQGIITDPPAAYNPEPQGYLNSFNWYQGLAHPDPQVNGRNYQLAYKVGATVTVGELFMPWEQPDNISVANVVGQRDRPKDGWELIRRNLGYTDAGTAVGVTDPYVILYNRSTGMLRVFVGEGELLGPNKMAEIKLTFAGNAGKKAGTLNRQSALGVALEDTEPGLNSGEMISVTNFLNKELKWFMADFPMEYDPCACLFDSKFSIEVRLISEADIRMTGVTTGSLATVTANSKTTGAEFDKGTPILKKVNGAVAAGGKVYGNLNKLASSLKSKEDAQGGPNSAAAPARKLLIDQFKTALSQNNFLKQGLAALPYVGAAVGALDFFFGGGKEESTTQPIALQPMTIEMTTQFTGTITASNLYTSVLFNNPGTRQQALLPENYPYYNETMGVFSLIRRPVVEQSSQEYWNDAGQLRRIVSFRVPQDLQYAINPASRLTVQDFQAALVIEQTNPDATGNGWFSAFEAMKKSGTGALVPVYRTEYQNSGNLRDYVFTLETYGGGTVNRQPGDLYINGQTQVYLKLLLNLRDINTTPTTQNTLLVTKYPVTLTNVLNVGEPGAADRPAVLPQLSPASLTSFCTGQVYADVMALRPGMSASTGSSSQANEAGFMLFPNPATRVASIRLHLAKAGNATITVRDAMGRLLYQNPTNKAYAAGATQVDIPTDTFANGLYYCTVVVNGHQQTQKLLVAH